MYFDVKRVEIIDLDYGDLNLNRSFFHDFFMDKPGFIVKLSGEILSICSNIDSSLDHA